MSLLMLFTPSEKCFLQAPNIFHPSEFPLLCASMALTAHVWLLGHLPHCILNIHPLMTELLMGWSDAPADLPSQHLTHSRHSLNMLMLFIFVLGKSLLAKTPKYSSLCSASNNFSDKRDCSETACGFSGILILYFSWQ